MQFEPVKTGPKGDKHKRQEQRKHLLKTLGYMLAGAAIGLVIGYFSESSGLDTMSADEIRNSLITGAFFGFFITNSPCARGRC